MNRGYIYLHIPKTAGSTFNAIIDRNFGRKANVFTSRPFDENYSEESTRCYLENSKDTLLSLSSEQRENIDILKGHLYFGIHRLFTKEYKYITFVRNPIDRVISNFEYIRRLPSNESNYKLISLLEFVDGNMDLSVSNLQTRMISGEKDPNVEIEKAHLKVAKEHIDKYFDFVGLTERFDESLILMRRQGILSKLRYKPLNIGRYRGKNIKPVVGAKALKLIHERNIIDMQLYEYVHNKLVNKVTGAIRISAKGLKLSNKLYNGLKLSK